jgi:hypothetical protein
LTRDSILQTARAVNHVLRFADPGQHSFRDDTRPAPTVDPSANRTLERYRSLPYGIAIARDGRTIWFDRRYRPLASVEENGRFTALTGEWITFRPVLWFYNDANPPRSNRRTRVFLETLLSTYPDLAHAVAMRFAAVTGKTWPTFH